MIALIINADDLGCNPARDRGILQAFQQGLVTSASLLANGPSFSSAVAQAKAAGLPLGVHLNLADGQALTGQIKGLTDAKGRLPGKTKLRQFLQSGGCDPEALRKELQAQIQRLFDAGAQPDHIDSHQHCQIFPCLTMVTIDLAKEFGILKMRTACPAEAPTLDAHSPVAKELALYRQLGRKAHETIRSAGIQTPDGLYGMPLLNRLETSSLCQLLETIPAGFWELMVHPGLSTDSASSFDGPRRQVELEALLAAPAQQIVRRRQIRLSDFGDLPCAS